MQQYNSVFSKLLAVLQCCNTMSRKLLAVATHSAINPAEGASLYVLTFRSYLLRVLFQNLTPTVALAIQSFMLSFTPESVEKRMLLTRALTPKWTRGLRL